MPEPTYIRALERAWTLVWNHKTTWMFGILAVFLGQWGLGNFLGYFINDNLTPFSWWPATWGAIHITTFNELILFGWLGIIVIAVGAGLAVAAVCAQGALIVTAVHWYKFHTVLSVKSAWHQGVKHFWTLFGIFLLGKSALIAIAGITTMLMRVFSVDTLVGFIGAILTLSLGMLAGLIMSAVTTYSAGYAVIDARSAISALARGWRLFWRHVLVSFELSILLLLLSLVVLLILGGGAFLVVAPSVGLSIVAGFTGHVNLLAGAAVLYVVLFIALIVIVGGIFNAFTINAWMYLFMKMHHEGVISRLVHWGRKIVRRQ